MIINRFLRYLFFVSIVFTQSCKNGINPKTTSIDESYLYTDIQLDEFYPAAQVELQIPSKGSTIYGVALTANGKGPHPTVLLLHGLPGNERGLDIAQNLRRAGFNVMYFNYRGTWGSKGRFSFKNAIQDAGEVVSYVSTAENQELLKVDTSKIFFAGHSMGAGIAMIAGIQDARVKGVVGISVFNPYTLFQGDEGKGNLISLNEYLLTLGMLNTNPKIFLNDILQDVENYNIEQLVVSSKKPLLVIDEHMNNTYFSKYNKGKNFEYKMWNTDHAFTNKRIALSRTIRNWLADALEETQEN